MAVLNVRDIDRDTIERIKRAASARGWTIARYLHALALLHESARARADAGDTALQSELQALGLDTQRV